mgnify:FL=1
MDLKRWIRDVPDHPKPGILFRDLTPLLEHPRAFKFAIDCLTQPFRNEKIGALCAVEARGFLVGAPMAISLGTPLVLLRKANKLPRSTVGENFNLEYGSDRIEVHQDALRPSQRVVIVDDLLATGGTARAAASVVTSIGAEVAAYAFLIEIKHLLGRAALGGSKIHSAVQY